MSEIEAPSALQAEAQRLAVVGSLHLREMPPEPGVQALVEATRLATGCASAALAVVEAERVLSIAHVGAVQPDLPRSQTLCHAVVAGGEFLEVPDTWRDARFADLDPVKAAVPVRFYAAAPVRIDGEVVGSLCVMDPQVRHLPSMQRDLMRRMAETAAAILAQRRKRLEGHEQMARLHDLARASGDWMWELDREGRCVWISGDFEGSTGLPPSEVLGKPLSEEVLVDHSGEPLVPREVLQSLLSRQKPFSRVLSRCQTARGTLWLSRSALPVFGPHGEFLGYRGTARNMTSRLRAEREQREQDERLQRLSAEVPGALVQFIVPAQGGPVRYRYASAGLARWITPVTDAEIEVCPLGPADDIVAEDLPRWQAALAQSLKRLRPLHVEYRMRRRGAAARWFETRATPQRLADGSTLFHGFTADVTARYALEASRQENDELRRDKSAAEEASRAKSAFLSRASHELRTPLNAVIGFAQLMAMDRVNALPPEQAHRLVGLRTAGQRLLDLVNDLLDVARIEEGGLHLRSEPVDAQRMVETGLATVRPMAAIHGIRLSIDVPPGVAIQGDPMALEQVLINLLSNAIKYNRVDGEVRVDVVPDEDRVLLSVQDEGPGLDDEARSQLFQPFNRLGAERRRIQGSGLGLVIVKELVQAMGGQIEVHSSLDQGSQFLVRLPKAHAAPVTEAPPRLLQPLPEAQPSPRVRHILYVEDEPLNVLLMEEVFRTQPHWHLHVATDGAAGLALAQTQALDLALIDMNLPDMSGMEVLRRLRADPATETLSCVALSADALNEQIEVARAAGFDDYWTKPIDLQRLVHAIAARLPVL